MKNLWKLAAEKKYRFQTNRGDIPVETLFDLSLKDLDKIAIDLNKQLKEATEESFIQKATPENTHLKNVFDLVLEVIEHKQAKAEARKNRLAKQEQLAELEALMADKKREEMKNLSADEIAKRIAELKG